MLIGELMAPLFYALTDGNFGFRVTTLMSLGLLLGLLFRILEGSSEIGKNVSNVNKCRFSLFSDRKNDTYFIDIPYI